MPHQMDRHGQYRTGRTWPEQPDKACVLVELECCEMRSLYLELLPALLGARWQPKQKRQQAV